MPFLLESCSGQGWREQKPGKPMPRSSPAHHSLPSFKGKILDGSGIATLLLLLAFPFQAQPAPPVRITTAKLTVSGVADLKPKPTTPPLRITAAKLTVSGVADLQPKPQAPPLKISTGILTISGRSRQ
jgi:hypothetical protein